MSDGHTYFLRRSDSLTSISSIVGDRKHNTADAHGALQLDMHYQRPKLKEKTEGTLHILVKEGRGLIINEPYVKLYLSKDGKDIRGTKQKTKSHKKKGSPIFEERFVYYLKKGTSLDSSNRLQITVWDHSSLSSNKCMGGFSFGLEEILKRDRLVGWWQLLPEADGRTTNEFLGHTEDVVQQISTLVRSTHLERSNSQTSLASTSSKTAQTPVGAKQGKRLVRIFRGGKQQEKKKANETNDQEQSTNHKGDENLDKKDPDVHDFEKIARDFSRFGQRVPSRLDESGDENDVETTLNTGVSNKTSQLERSTQQSTTNARQSIEKQTLSVSEGVKNSVQKEVTTNSITATTTTTESTRTNHKQTSLSGAYSSKMNVLHEVSTSQQKYRIQEVVTDHSHSPLHVSPSNLFSSKRNDSNLNNYPHSVDNERQQVDKHEHDDDNENDDDDDGDEIDVDGDDLSLANFDNERTTEEHYDSSSTKVPQNITAWNEFDEQEQTPLGQNPPSKPQRGVSRSKGTSESLTGQTGQDSPESTTEPINTSIPRSGSLTSLLSLSPEQIVTSAVVRGVVHISIQACPQVRGRRKKIRIDIHGAKNLLASSPYLKLYISKNGTDVKSTKWKSTVGKKNSNFLPSASTTLELPETVDKYPTAHRLQVSVWDKARLRTNECTGSFSVAIPEILEKGSISGWFRLLPYHSGRTTHIQSEEPHVPSSTHQHKADDIHEHCSPHIKANEFTLLEPSSSTPIAEREDIEKKSDETDNHCQTLTASSNLDRAAFSKNNSTTIFAPLQQSASGLTGSTSASGLRRAGSFSSLVSSTSSFVTSAQQVRGELRLNIFFEPIFAPELQVPTNSKAHRHISSDTGAKGYIRVTVNEGRSLACQDTYVKLYLSKRGKNIRTSKHKTKVQRKTNNPIYQETFRIAVPSSLSLDEDTRLQLSLWDHARLRANECLGAMSFNLLELASTTVFTGWFRLLPYSQGTVAYARGHDSATSSPAAARRILDARSLSDENGGSVVEAKLHQQLGNSSQVSEDAVSSSGISGKSAGAAPSFTPATANTITNSSGNKRRLALLGGGSRSLQKELGELQRQLMELEGENKRHIVEKAQLEEKLQKVREENSQYIQSYEEQIQSLVGSSGSMKNLLSEKEALEVDKQRLEDMVRMLTLDARGHRDTIASLRDRVDDLTTEIKFLRLWKGEMTSELMALSPKAFTRATVAVSESYLGDSDMDIVQQ